MPDITAATTGGPLSAERLAEWEREAQETLHGEGVDPERLLVLLVEVGRLRERIEAAADGLTARSGDFNPQWSMERNRAYSDALAFAAEFVRDPSKFSGTASSRVPGEAEKK